MLVVQQPITQATLVLQGKCTLFCVGLHLHHLYAPLTTKEFEQHPAEAKGAILSRYGATELWCRVPPLTCKLKG